MIITSIIILLVLFTIILSWINLPGNFIFLFSIFLMEYFEIIDPVKNKFFLIAILIFIGLEIVEFLLSALVIKLYGGTTSSSYLSILGAIIGSIIGTFIFPIIGSVVGLILGAYMITYYNEKNNGKSIKEATDIANSSILSFVLTKSLKSISIIWTAYYLIK
ncbi:DUF456 domain-containing protein [bacterium]|nr:DUF456 domain-containing protein [bacterium]